MDHHEIPVKGFSHGFLKGFITDSIKEIPLKIMNNEYLKAYCKDLIHAASELGGSNEQILKELNSMFLDIMNNSVSNFIIMRRLKSIENKIQNIKYKNVPIVSNLTKRALIISNNENDSIYFNSIFKDFTTLSISRFENKEKLKECLEFVSKGKTIFIFTSIPLEIPFLHSTQNSIVIGTKCQYKNNPTIEICDNSMFGQKESSISRFLFITCSALYNNSINCSIIKDFLNCDIKVNGNDYTSGNSVEFVL